MTIVGLILKRLIQLLLLATAGIAVAYAVIAKSEYAQHHWVPRGLWVSLLVFTTITFLAVAVEFRRHWHQFRFWVALLALLTGHVIAYAILLLNVREWPLVLFAIVAVAETPVLCVVMDRAGFRAP